MFSIQPITAVAKAIKSIEERISVVFERGCEYHDLKEGRESSQELISSWTLINENFVFLAIEFYSDLNVSREVCFMESRVH